MRQLGRVLGRFLGRYLWDLPGEEEVLIDSFQHIVLNSSGYCFTCSGAVLRSNGLSYDTVNDVASAGYVVPLQVLASDGSSKTVTTTVLASDAGSYVVAGTTTMYVFGGVPVTTPGTPYRSPVYTVRDSDGNYYTVTNAVLASDAGSFDVVGKILNSGASQITTVCGERIVVQDADGFYHAATLRAKNSSGTIYTVTSVVKASDAGTFTVN